MPKTVYIKCSSCGDWVLPEHFEYNREDNKMFCAKTHEIATGACYNERFESTTLFVRDIVKIPIIMETK